MLSLLQMIAANSKKVEETVHEVKHEFDKLIHGFTNMQEDFVSSMITMQRNLTDLAMTEYGERRQYFANSLKEFKHNYDEKIEHLLPPPCFVQYPDPPTAALEHPSRLHLLPPPWPAQKNLSLAALKQPSTVHLRPPP